MFEEFLFDLKVARKKSGLTQADCGHLVGATNHIISQIERGRRMPTIREICTLSLIYGRSFESFYAETFRQVRKSLECHLETMPDVPKDWPGRFAREITLERLGQRLLAEANPDHGF